MNPDTGEIREFSCTFDAEEAGFTVPIEQEKLPDLQAMNRQQRRRWAAQQARRKRPGQNRQRKHGSK